MTIGIYGIFDARDESCLYVGQSKTIEERWKAHLNLLRIGNHRADFNAHFLSIEKDENLLVFRILEECENIDLVKNRAEIQWFNLLSPRFYGKFPTLNEKWTHSEETRAKISQGLLNSAKVRSKVLLRKQKQEAKLCVFCGTSFNIDKRKTCSDQCSSNLIAHNMTVIPDASYEKLYQLWIIEDVSIDSLAITFNCSSTSAYRILGNQNLPTKKSEVNKLREALGIISPSIRQCLVCNGEVTSPNKRAKTCSSICRYKLRDVSVIENRRLQLI